MAEQNKNATAGQPAGQVQAPAVDIEAMLKAQEEKFAKQMAEQNEAMQAKIDAMAEQNQKLTEELDNLKTNTAEENALLGEKIAKVAGKEELPAYNPFEKDILYTVKNEIAGIETVMTGDEVKGIIGSIDKHLRIKLIKGDKKIEKHPYIITLFEKKGE